MQLKEMSAAQSHFNDVCALVEHPTPTQFDPKGERFTFEAPTEKAEGGIGRADVWYKGKFIWEYKGAHADLDKAYQQLLRYRESLGNPPLLVTSDMDRIVIHTNFTDTMTQTHEVTLKTLAEGPGLELLKRVFDDPDSFKPPLTRDDVTKATADTFVAVANTLQKWGRASGDRYDPERLAHFLVRLLFCLFAEDMGLLQEKLFSETVRRGLDNTKHFETTLRDLFKQMKAGGTFGWHHIRQFDGGLFDDDFVPELPGDVPHSLVQACRQDWGGVNPSIFGTLFERVIDEAKRAQLGAHYTSEDDILLIVEPVLMRPLREEWHELRRQATHLMRVGQDEEARALLQRFADRLARVRVLDPACGSGNFLYVALRLLLDLQKEVIAFAARQGLGEIALSVSPAQLYGIEINPYAHELAQITVWIGYIQWRFDNGFGDIEDPVLRPLENIRQMDAILTYDAEGRPVEPEWPEAYTILGNPPFLGGNKIRQGLSDKYVDNLFALYASRVPASADLVCYWYEKARAMIAEGKAKRAGLLATQGIRGGANRRVLERIKETGDIFMAWSDRPWILDGAMVHVSVVGFDDASQADKMLDNVQVATINADLSASTDLTLARPLAENAGIGFRGNQKGGPFDISQDVALGLLACPNRSGKPNSDVIKPWINGFDVAGRPRQMWLIDFGVDASLEEAAQYEKPFAYVQRTVAPKYEHLKKRWWIHERVRPEMRAAISRLQRYIVTPHTSKHRLFAWLDNSTIPDHGLVVFAREDDYFFGVLHSKVHELWARHTGTQLREAESGFRYTPSTTFETYPLPWSPSQEPSGSENEHVAAIAAAARELDAFRHAWLNPPGVGVTISERMVAKRTLTNLYNALEKYRAEIKGKQRNPRQWDQEAGGIITLEEIEELDQIHNELDRAVFDAYGWPHNLTDEDILARLLALNLERAKAHEPTDKREG